MCFVQASAILLFPPVDLMGKKADGKELCYTAGELVL